MAQQEQQLTLGDLVDCPCREGELVQIALSLGARKVRGWSKEEERLAQAAVPVPRQIATDFRQRIEAGEDPLGDAFCRIRTAPERREKGATFTPAAIVDAMVDWAADAGRPQRIVDPGIGSGRYLLAAGRRMPQATLFGVEIDPFPAMLARANLAVAGLAGRAEVVVGDYRATYQGAITGQTLYIGNPPYVRHHSVAGSWKTWLVAEAAKLGHAASQLAGLHVHFFLATAIQAVPGDYGAYITAGEWLDVNYGSLVRELFLSQLGGRRITVIEPTAMPFPDAATTAAITYFQIGERPGSIQLKRVSNLAELNDHNGDRVVPRERFESQPRWSPLTRRRRKGREGYVELGELCRVHRGQVTGLNKVWIAGPDSAGLPDRVLFPSVTKARELFEAGLVLEDASALRRVIDLPVDLDVFDACDRKAIDRHLSKAKALGAHLGYVATNRRAWWSVGLREPAPILATYMARRPPAFVHNRAQARHINIAHGVYPREPLGQNVLENLVRFLRRAVQLSDGRTYAGGLTKFEPREMERLLVPGLELLIPAA